MTDETGKDVTNALLLSRRIIRTFAAPSTGMSLRVSWVPIVYIAVRYTAAMKELSPSCPAVVRAEPDKSSDLPEIT